MLNNTMIDATIVLELEKAQSWPKYQFSVLPLSMVECPIDDDRKQVVYQFVLDTRFSLMYYDKTSDETIVDCTGTIVKDQTLLVHSVYVDGILIKDDMLKYMSQYSPNYREDFIKYCIEHNIDIDYSPQKNLKFWHPGEWTLEWTDDFWKHYQSVRKALYPKADPNYTGYTHEDIERKLVQIKNLIDYYD
jgi:hypothetical protein